MNTTTPRDLTWEELRDKLDGTRAVVWKWLLNHGPATTTEIARHTGIGLLTVRPRVCELASWGFAECIGRKGREGIYKALPAAVAESIHAGRQTRETQLPLNLPTS